MTKYILLRLCLYLMTFVHLHQVYLFVSSAAPPPTQSGDIRPVNYNPLRPPKKGDSPVRVKVNIHVNTLLSVEEFEQSFTVDVVYKLTWNDYRLRLPTSDNEFPLILDISWKSKVWVPDVYFENALKTSVLHGFSPITFLEVDKENNVSLMARLTVKLNCDMELFAYPHDTQECFFDSTSLSYSPKHLVLEWGNFTVDKAMYFPKFRIFQHTTVNNCTWSNSNEIETPERSCVRGILKLSRKFSFYMTRYYAPSILIVLTTFIGFWIPALAWPARIGAVVTPLLSLITIHNTVNNEVKVSYVVAIHIWLFICMFFTFMGLIEYLFALTYANMITDAKAKYQRLIDANEKEANFTVNNNNNTNNGQLPPSTLLAQCNRSKAKNPNSTRRKITAKIIKLLGLDIDFNADPLNRNKIDYVARFAFPALYMMFILGYFTVFVTPWMQIQQKVLNEAAAAAAATIDNDSL